MGSIGNVETKVELPKFEETTKETIVETIEKVEKTMTDVINENENLTIRNKEMIQTLKETHQTLHNKTIELRVMLGNLNETPLI